MEKYTSGYQTLSRITLISNLFASWQGNVRKSAMIAQNKNECVSLFILSIAWVWEGPTARFTIATAAEGGMAPLRNKPPVR